MRKSGRKSILLTDEQKKAVDNYFNSDLTLNQVAENYGVTKGALQYWINKSRKEKEDAEQINGGKAKSN